MLVRSFYDGQGGVPGGDLMMKECMGATQKSETSGEDQVQVPVAAVEYVDDEAAGQVMNGVDSAEQLDVGDDDRHWIDDDDHDHDHVLCHVRGRVLYPSHVHVLQDLVHVRMLNVQIAVKKVVALARRCGYFVDVEQHLCDLQFLSRFLERLEY